ncbi:uncharacterized protein LOC129098867 isoform X2 [Anoplopoma fimbria]|uniref:uncharacterized protein LOC129098867 isoform X2 n=1 Tax=Anoplopoma fimbria TaxID=229290 RepID=UPI0023EDCB07|nr:uncharacterized protein LOC129098867 isoform X2 [Anoplopoma fimbria]
MTLLSCQTCLIMVLCIGNSLECPQTNTFCNDIRTAEGFQFLHRCPKGSDISVLHKGTVLALAVLGNQTTSHSKGMIIISNNSVVTGDCRDLELKCIVPKGEDLVDESCVDYKVTECLQTNCSCNDIRTAEGFQFLHQCPKGSEISVLHKGTVLALAVLGNQTTSHSEGMIIISNNSVVTRDCRDLELKCKVSKGKKHIRDICTDYKVTEMLNPDSTTSQNLIIAVSVCVGLIVSIGVICWKKKQVASIVSRFLRNLRISERETERTEPTRLSEISATEPRGSGDNDIDQVNTLESVHVNSNDPTADGKAAQSFGLDHNSNKVENGDVIAPDGNWDSNHPAENRSLRDDPGGSPVNDDNGKAKVGIGEMHSGGTDVDPGAEDHGNEEQPLLLSQRAASQGFDMTAKAGALVDKPGFDPDQVSRYSTVPGADVESTPDMKNCSMNKY